MYPVPKKYENERLCFNRRSDRRVVPIIQNQFNYSI